GDPDNLEVRP
ncbi:hypothetical protein A2U01_0119651, partial [Trifolium medium]|nr:hypothetical protein [Trifolium medium]